MIGKRIIWAVSLAALLFLIPLQSSLSLDFSEQSQSIELNRQHGRIMPALFQVELQAAEIGWTPALLQTAGDLWYEAGDLTQALPYWVAASAELPDDPLLARHLAEAYLALQRWPDAVDQLEHLVAIDSTDAWAHYHLGMLRTAFDPQAAVQHLQMVASVPDYSPIAVPLLEALAGAQNDPLVGMPVGFALVQGELWPYAELAFQHAANVDPNYAAAQAYVGLARDRQGKDGGAWIARA
jgi:tetratricopeptide (TPR) repeat protein